MQHSSSLCSCLLVYLLADTGVTGSSSRRPARRGPPLLGLPGLPSGRPTKPGPRGGHGQPKPQPRAQSSPLVLDPCLEPHHVVYQGHMEARWLAEGSRHHPPPRSESRPASRPTGSAYSQGQGGQAREACGQPPPSVKSVGVGAPCGPASMPAPVVAGRCRPSSRRPAISAPSLAVCAPAPKTRSGIGSKLRIPLRTRASISETGPPSAAPRAPELPPRLARLAQLAHTSVPSHRVVGRKAVSASSQGSGCQDKFDAQPQPQTKARDLTRRARNRWTTPVEPKSTSGIGRQPLGNTSAAAPTPTPTPQLASKAAPRRAAQPWAQQWRVSVRHPSAASARPPASRGERSRTSLKTSTPRKQQSRTFLRRSPSRGKRSRTYFQPTPSREKQSKICLQPTLSMGKQSRTPFQPPTSRGKQLRTSIQTPTSRGKQSSKISYPATFRQARSEASLRPTARSRQVQSRTSLNSYSSKKEQPITFSIPSGTRTAMSRYSLTAPKTWKETKEESQKSRPRGQHIKTLMQPSQTMRQLKKPAQQSMRPRNIDRVAATRLPPRASRKERRRAPLKPSAYRTGRTTTSQPTRSNMELSRTAPISCGFRAAQQGVSLSGASLLAPVSRLEQSRIPAPARSTRRSRLGSRPSESRATTRLSRRPFSRASQADRADVRVASGTGRSSLPDAADTSPDCTGYGRRRLPRNARAKMFRPKAYKAVQDVVPSVSADRGAERRSNTERPSRPGPGQPSRPPPRHVANEAASGAPLTALSRGVGPAGLNPAMLRLHVVEGLLLPECIRQMSDRCLAQVTTPSRKSSPPKRDRAAKSNGSGTGSVRIAAPPTSAVSTARWYGSTSPKRRQGLPMPDHPACTATTSGGVPGAAGARVASAGNDHAPRTTLERPARVTRRPASAQRIEAQQSDAADTEEASTPSKPHRKQRVGQARVTAFNGLVRTDCIPAEPRVRRNAGPRAGLREVKDTRNASAKVPTISVKAKQRAAVASRGTKARKHF